MTLTPLAYKIPDAARVVGLSAMTLRREIAAGRLAVRYSGRSPLIAADELKSWFDSLPSERA